MQKNYDLTVLLNEIETMMKFQIISIAIYPDGSLGGFDKENNVIVKGNYYHWQYILGAFIQIAKLSPQEYQIYIINTEEVLYDPFFYGDCSTLRYLLDCERPSELNSVNVLEFQKLIESRIPRIKDKFRLDFEKDKLNFICFTPESNKLIVTTFNLFKDVAIC